jgi:glycosyltransferase involved in cell wall biosynthesis
VDIYWIKMKKILFIQQGLGYGGATKSLLLLQKRIYKKFKLFTVSQTVYKRARPIINDFKKYSAFYELDFPKLLYFATDTTSNEDFEKIKNYYPEGIIKFIKENEIDIVHVNSSIFPHLLKPIKEHTEVKLVVHIREMLRGKDSEIFRFFIENHIRYADKIIAISDNEVQYYPPSDKILILPNPHEFDVTDKVIKEGDKKNSEEIIVGMCASFMEYKGHLDFLRMADAINRSGNSENIHFKIVGYPYFEKTLKGIVKFVLNYGYKPKFDKLVKQLNITNLHIVRYTFDIYPALNTMDIIVRPDYTGNPWGRDIIEAMAMRKPIVATGTSEFFLENGKTGYLVPPRNPKAMADKVLELINDEKKRIRFGEAGYKKIRGMCDIEEYGNKICQLYLNL